MIADNILKIINLPNTYIGTAPISKDVCQWIKATSGMSHVYFLKDTYDEVHFTLYARNTVNKKAYETIKTMYDSLKNYVGKDFTIIVNRLPHLVGKDNNNRTIYSFSIKYNLGGY